MNIWITVGIIILALLLIAYLILVVVLSTFTTHPKTTPMADGWKLETSKPFMQGLDMRPSSVYTITGYNGYVLHASFLPAYDNMSDYEVIDEYNYTEPSVHLSGGPSAPDGYNVEGRPHDCNKQRFVIISHGYTYNRHGSLKYASIFRKLGYNCIIYDNRGHGENSKSLTTFGRDESRDLLAVIDDTKQRFGEDIALGVSGESMGSGLSITALKYDPKIDFVLADCGYADLKNVTDNTVKNKFHLPLFTGALGGVISGILYGFNYNKARPIDSLSDAHIPICFVHGGADDFIFPVNSQRMHEAYQGYSEYHEYEGAGHGLSIDTDYERYEKMVTDFLDKVYNDR